MAKKASKEKEADDGIRARGLIKFISTLPSDTCNQEDMISAIASAASKQTNLISNDDKVYLTEIEDSKFFDIQVILCKLIPIIDTSAVVLMELVLFLVERGGRDCAANRPNTAFLKWCRTDFSRVDDVIKLAKEGDTIACKHLIFALQAKGEVCEAISFLERSPQEQIAGALALPQMQLDNIQYSVALKKIVSLAIAADTKTAYRFTRSAYDIAAKHPEADRNELYELLKKVFISDDEWIIHLAASLLNYHHMEMIKTEFDLCLHKISKVDPKNKGTVEEIDQAMIWLLKAKKIHKASHVIYNMIQTSGEGDSIIMLEAFFRELTRNHSKSLAKLTTDWFQRGDFLPCSILARAISKLNETKPAIGTHNILLPSSEKDQKLLCRKAVGYLFFQPMNAAAFLVAVINRGHPDAKNAARELLFNPLLLSYGGALPNWLKTVAAENESCRESIDEVLKRAKKVWNGFELALKVVELEPSRSKRDVITFQEMDEAEHIHDEAYKRSVFFNIMKSEYMIYGDETVISEIDSSGNAEQRTTSYDKIEMRTELPTGVFCDPVGLEIVLDQFRYERSIKK